MIHILSQIRFLAFGAIAATSSADGDFFKVAAADGTRRTCMTIHFQKRRIAILLALSGKVFSGRHFIFLDRKGKLLRNSMTKRFPVLVGS